MAYIDNDVEPVVIDNGTWMCKAGHAGDKTARVYERTLLGKTTASEKCSEFIGDEASLQREVLHLTRPMSRGVVTDWDSMERFWEWIFRQQLRTGKEDTSMLITEVPGAPPSQRRHMTEILMEKFRIPALYISNPAYLCLLASGRTTGAVFEVGGGVAHASLVIKGSEVKGANKRSEIGGNDVTDCLVGLLRDRRAVTDSTTQDYTLLGDDLKHHLTTWLASESNPDRSNEYSFTDGSCVSIDEDICKCFDVLFEPSKIGSDAAGIDELLYDVISYCDPAVRGTICSNIIVGGGAAFCPDITDRLRSRLQERGITQELKIIAPPERRKSAWLGGSILASLEEFPGLCKSRQMYEENGWEEFLTFNESETILHAES